MTDQELVTRFFVEGYTDRNDAFIMECLSDDYVDHSPAGARGNAEALEILKIVAEQFSPLKVTVEDIFSENGMVAVRVRYEGIHVGTCIGVPATGKQICFEALEHFRIADGKIVESWGYWPDMEIQRQLLG